MLARCAAIMMGAGYEHSGARSVKKLELCGIYIELSLNSNIRCLRFICPDSQHALMRGSRVLDHSRPRSVGDSRHLDRRSEVMRRSALSTIPRNTFMVLRDTLSHLDIGQAVGTNGIYCREGDSDGWRRLQRRPMRRSSTERPSQPSVLSWLRLEKLGDSVRMQRNHVALSYDIRRHNSLSG
jgi:hypothetical protein